MAHELQERYSKLVLAKLRKTSIFSTLFNNRYEGTPTAGAVKIPVRDTETTVGDYKINEGGELSFSSTTYKTLPIDRDKYVNELIDGYEADKLEKTNHVGYYDKILTIGTNGSRNCYTSWDNKKKIATGTSKGTKKKGTKILCKVVAKVK